MTIKGIKTFFQKIKFDKFHTVKLDVFREKVVTFDVSTIIHRTFHSAVKSLMTYVSFDPAISTWVTPTQDDIRDAFITKITRTFELIARTGIHPVLVFDGETPKLKDATRQKRVDTTQMYMSRVDMNTYTEDFIKNFIRSQFPDESIHQVTEEIALSLGFRVLRSNFEAEGLASSLASTSVNVSSLVVCEDHDCLMYNPRLVGKKLSIRGDDVYVTVYEPIDILRSMNFISESCVIGSNEYTNAMDRLILLLIVSGNDYTDGVRGLGLCKIYDMMMKHNIHAFEHLCQINNKFLCIPFTDIINTLNANCSVI